MYVGAFLSQRMLVKAWHARCLQRSDFFQKLHRTCYTSQKQLQLMEKNITMITSDMRWEEYPSGIEFDVLYLDSQPSMYLPKKLSKKLPTVLAIHGAPGCHRDFLQILLPLADQGACRILVPNLPGYGYTKGCMGDEDNVFMHTTDEKAEFIIDFLGNLNIDRIDLAIGHSYGNFPLMKICARTDIIKSLMMVCPTPPEPHKAVRPYSFIKALGELYEDKYIRPFVKLFMFVAKRYIGFGSFSTRDVVQSLRNVSMVDYNDINSFILEMNMKKINSTFIYSDNDKLIETELSINFAERLGVKSGRFVKYSKEEAESGEVKSLHGYPRCIVFDSGTHSPMGRPGYSDIITQEIQHLIKQTETSS